MEIQLFARNLEITPRLREYVETKVGKLDRYLDIDSARIDLAVENTRSSAHRQVAQLTVRTRGTILRVEERASDMFAAIDMALDKMRRQVSRYKKRRQNRRQRGGEVPLEEGEEAVGGEIVRVKRFELVPMTPSEAVEQMELLGHQFFVFFDADEGVVSVVYRRRDGNYGLIVPAVR
jgi:putative sigma-54 modulation protein